MDYVQDGIDQSGKMQEFIYGACAWCVRMTCVDSCVHAHVRRFCLLINVHSVSYGTYTGPVLF